MNNESMVWVVATGFAAAAHIKQKRKYTDEPYISHCQEVGGILLRYTQDPEIAAAGMLHDVIEDTEITAEDMRSVFSKVVVDLVLEVTDISKPSDGNREQRKAIDLAHIAGCSQNAANIKYADLISNTKSIAQYDKDFAKVYLPEKRKIMEALEGKGNAPLRAFALKTLELAEKELYDK